jgi:hypothetical protein
MGNREGKRGCKELGGQGTAVDLTIVQIHEHESRTINGVPLPATTPTPKSYNCIKAHQSRRHGLDHDRLETLDRFCSVLTQRNCRCDGTMLHLRWSRNGMWWDWRRRSDGARWCLSDSSDSSFQILQHVFLQHTTVFSSALDVSQTDLQDSEHF